MTEVRARLLGPAMLDSGLFDAAAIARLLNQHASRTSDHAGPIWLLLTFEGFLLHTAGVQLPAPNNALARVA